VPGKRSAAQAEPAAEILIKASTNSKDFWQFHQPPPLRKCTPIRKLSG
jgi:hypothetical protein